MKRIRMVIRYDGTNYSGYQVQPNGNTIQAELEKALRKMHKGQLIKVTASGRTDARVHAIGQVIHFDTPLQIPIGNWKRALNSLLPEDIQVSSVDQAADDFHARYDTSGKEYRYYVRNHQEPDPFRRNYTYHVKAAIDIDAIKAACRYLEGEHDFTSFCSPKTDIKGSKVRTIYQADVSKRGDEVIFIFRGSGFLYNMVRILVGTLLEVGRKERRPEDIQRIIAAKDRIAAGKTAPPQGLFLWKVFY
ncbi:tRNA pseudouridine38-40 synthase [Halobacillus karajensis]|uniref:tRNA pseudouridine synthase A n=1 Tax=Halobacillus karajensis TaxID=195088 RepID=A0A024P999_9BACI|nr:tRNA pseudouridine(38-40) synthase TruA [Halobacillus karajensis]CDQ21606.1 tRNA pseudouridine synthase A [Halobacillus karajensis]CDQ25684.1 tRNA pseudouridine synthase A [Halobacillus karajensis]CDQ29646.1 tRNA pseudouridine synthase A [Halobacillus karajensis]SEI11422.1 tRNA pseudouridine38-40 synthase [Halobacillus karajensis]